MNDLDVELRTNIEIVIDKRNQGSSDAETYINDLAEDVREFLIYMGEELDSATT